MGDPVVVRLVVERGSAQGALAGRPAGEPYNVKLYDKPGPLPEHLIEIAPGRVRGTLELVRPGARPPVHSQKHEDVPVQPLPGSDEALGESEGRAAPLGRADAFRAKSAAEREKITGVRGTAAGG